MALVMNKHNDLAAAVAGQDNDPRDALIKKLVAAGCPPELLDPMNNEQLAMIGVLVDGGNPAQAMQENLLAARTARVTHEASYSKHAEQVRQAKVFATFSEDLRAKLTRSALGILSKGLRDGKGFKESMAETEAFLSSVAGPPRKVHRFTEEKTTPAGELAKVVAYANTPAMVNALGKKKETPEHYISRFSEARDNRLGRLTAAEFGVPDSFA